MSYAIRIHQTGGPEVLKWEEVDLPAPAAGEVMIRQSAVGLNYIDIYQRDGLYPIPIPGGLGVEGAGVIEAVGAGVTGFKPGDRVAYAGAVGAYAEVRNVPAASVLALPDGVSEEDAAATLLKGMTVQFLIRRTYAVGAGDTVLFHAAAGGVGLLACQWLSALGARVIGTVSSPEKAALAKANGCDETINYREENIVERVRDLTDGAGVPVVYDSVGKDTFETSLDCLLPRGMLVSYGNTTGPVDGVNIGVLAAKGSLYVTRPVLGAYIGTRAELEATAADLFAMMEAGKVKASIGQRYALKDAAKAQADLAAGKTVGATILRP
ncbi:quinone oxidoreductase [Hwanghaeella grinnelliae]|uniref:Quinone oxidoreductase n=1 Tax=Hwanghaeella grinnelliae TaxID=2500179 RepID=A0A437QWD1_9PROT|nr:quinone oxidoreductase [Hwanghaeella grinnelliae]RVU38837.1 quinone oxidoreductase [Hwanghaeella grinnelliae]